MAASSASSKLLNLRSPALQNLLRRRRLHPSAAASSHLLHLTSTNPTPIDAQFLLEKNGSADSPDPLSRARNSNLHVTNFPLNFGLPPFGYPVMQIEAAPKDDDDDFEDSDDDYDDFGDEIDDGDIENFSGSDSVDDDDDDEDADEDEDRKARRSYGK